MEHARCFRLGFAWAAEVLRPAKGKAICQCCGSQEGLLQGEFGVSPLRLQERKAWKNDRKSDHLKAWKGRRISGFLPLQAAAVILSALTFCARSILARFQEARACHPDKNPGDAEANAKFQKLADAYQAETEERLGWSSGMETKSLSLSKKTLN